MHDDNLLARFFWLVGGVLAVLGAVLWFTVPIRPMFPPYLATALLALGYSAWCHSRAAHPDGPPKS
jgi:hypothetical protein